VLNVDSATAQIVFGALILLTVALYGRERRMRDRV
jgi:ribose/xylose/arabinose/galactoside ABC-type transport system permease subunit